VLKNPKKLANGLTAILLARIYLLKMIRSALKSTYRDLFKTVFSEAHLKKKLETVISKIGKLLSK
jgi:hypothetical protein